MNPLERLSAQWREPFGPRTPADPTAVDCANELDIAFAELRKQVLALEVTHVEVDDRMLEMIDRDVLLELLVGAK